MTMMTRFSSGLSMKRMKVYQKCHGKVLDKGFEKQNQPESLWKRKTGSGAGKDNISDAPNGSTHHKKSVVEKELSHSPSNLVFGYLNLFSDGVHNFTGGMALGSAFLLYGSVGG
ncbi:hypothetical protein CsSME_00042918 [Camellia sinensis var. sinensis]